VPTNYIVWQTVLIYNFGPLKLVTDLNKLMERLEKYKRLKDDQLQDKAKAKLTMPEKKEVRLDRGSRPQKDFFPQVQK